MTNTVSEKGLQFVAQREAAVLKPYMDGVKLAIGFGDNDPALKGTDRITLDEAVERYVKKSNEYVAALNRIFPFEMEQHHFDALFSLAYNYGAGGLVKKTGLVSLVDRYYKTGRSPDTLKAIGEKIAALPTNNKRRRKEAAMFMNGDYGDLSNLLVWEKAPPSSPKYVPMPTFLGDK